MTRAPARPPARARGFTLLELLVALVIMAMSLAVLYRASGGSVRTVADIERREQALVLARSLLSMRDAVGEGGWSESGVSADFNWSVSTSPYLTDYNGLDIPPLHEVTVAVTWGEGGAARSVQFATLLPQRKPPVLPVIR